MSRPLRILLVTNKCPPDFDGGFELRAFQIAQALRARAGISSTSSRAATARVSKANAPTRNGCIAFSATCP